jgi:hypothetical protein
MGYQLRGVRCYNELVECHAVSIVTCTVSARPSGTEETGGAQRAIIRPRVSLLIKCALVRTTVRRADLGPGTHGPHTEHMPQKINLTIKKRGTEEQGMIEQNKTGQDMTASDSRRQGRTEQNRAEQDGTRLTLCALGTAQPFPL